MAVDALPGHFVRLQIASRILQQLYELVHETCQSVQLSGLVRAFIALALGHDPVRYADRVLRRLFCGP